MQWSAKISSLWTKERNFASYRHASVLYISRLQLFLCDNVLCTPYVVLSSTNRQPWKGILGGTMGMLPSNAKRDVPPKTLLLLNHLLDKLRSG